MDDQVFTMIYFFLFALAWPNFSKAPLLPIGPWTLLILTKKSGTCSPPLIRMLWKWADYSRTLSFQTSPVISPCWFSFPLKNSAYLCLPPPLPFKRKNLLFDFESFPDSWDQSVLPIAIVFLVGKAFPYYVHIWLGEGDEGVGGRAERGYIEFNYTSIKLLIFFSETLCKTDRWLHNRKEN